jgi:hypothetical protein
MQLIPEHAAARNYLQFIVNAESIRVHLYLPRFIGGTQWRESARSCHEIFPSRVTEMSE